MNDCHEEPIQQFAKGEGPYRHVLHNQAAEERENVVFDEYVLTSIRDYLAAIKSSAGFANLGAEVDESVEFPCFFGTPIQLGSEDRRRLVVSSGRPSNAETIQGQRDNIEPQILSVYLMHI